MVVFGLILLVLGVALLLSGLFGTDYDQDTSDPSLTTTELLGVNMGPEVVFLLGAVAGALILLGLWFMKSGTQRGWRRRKEQRRLEDLSEKLDRAEAERRGDEPDERS
jgi:hypothetical protein